MVGGGGCPAWCDEHVVGARADQHRLTLGDVRLTLSATADGWQATVAVRRRAGRTRAETTQLTVNMSAAADLLRRERGCRHVFRGNSVHDPATEAIAWV
jgi:hypothetical protein